QMRYVTSVERLATERGLQKGMEQGMQQGLQQGVQQGMQQGMQKEAQAILERLLRKRFGPLSPETRARLESATLDQLNHWADQILDAPTLAALFEEH
ncbi:MAG: DUF4351 domain-containing protein, partial [Gammaproteobacteria bacterium SHHR-1]